MAKIFNAHNHFGQKLKCSLNGFPYIIIFFSFCDLQLRFYTANCKFTYILLIVFIHIK